MNFVFMIALSCLLIALMTFAFRLSNELSKLGKKDKDMGYKKLHNRDGMVSKDDEQGPLYLIGDSKSTGN